MENGEWGMENGEWRMGNGEWGMENGEWGMGNGEWGTGIRHFILVVRGNLYPTRREKKGPFRLVGEGFVPALFSLEGTMGNHRGCLS